MIFFFIDRFLERAILIHSRASHITKLFAVAPKFSYLTKINAMFRPILLVLLLSTLHTCHGDLSILTSIPGKIIDTATQIFGLQNYGQNSRAVAPVTTNAAVEDSKMLAALKNLPKGGQNTAQKVADVQGDNNYNQNVNLQDNMGDFNVKSFGRSTNNNYGTFSQNLGV